MECKVEELEWKGKRDQEVNCLCFGGDEGKGKSVFKLITTVEGDVDKEQTVLKLINTVGMGVRA